MDILCNFFDFNVQVVAYSRENVCNAFDKQLMQFIQLQSMKGCIVELEIRLRSDVIKNKTHKTSFDALTHVFSLAEYSIIFLFFSLSGYGLTETSPCVSMSLSNDAYSSVGSPIANTAVKVIGADGSILSSYQRGEICVKGPQVITINLSDYVFVYCTSKRQFANIRFRKPIYPNAFYN